MSLVYFLGFNTLACGCVVGRYRDVATKRLETYVEEKGTACGRQSHRRNNTIPTIGCRGMSGLSQRSSEIVEELLAQLRESDDVV